MNKNKTILLLSMLSVCKSFAGTDDIPGPPTDAPLDGTVYQIALLFTICLYLGAKVFKYHRKEALGGVKSIN